MTAHPRRDCQCPRARHEHGTYAAYRRDRCRCFPCRIAESQFKASYLSGQHRTEHQWANTVGIRRRIEALHAIGWTWLEMGRRLGVTPQAVRDLTRKDRARAYSHTFEKVAALYDELSMQVPEGPYALRARRNAARLGYLPPLTWDDDTIDVLDTLVHTSRPSCTPAVVDEIAVEQAIQGRQVTLTRAELAEAVARMTSMGRGSRNIATVLGTNPRRVVRARARARAAA